MKRIQNDPLSAQALKEALTAVSKAPCPRELLRIMASRLSGYFCAAEGLSQFNDPDTDPDKFIQREMQRVNVLKKKSAKYKSRQKEMELQFELTTNFWSAAEELIAIYWEEWNFTESEIAEHFSDESLQLLAGFDEGEDWPLIAMGNILSFFHTMAVNLRADGKVTLCGADEGNRP